LLKTLRCEGRFATVENQFPVLHDVNIGHTTPMVTLPFDALAAHGSESGHFTLLWSGVA
jgi:muramoyltetrapeptide carboxypeptidase LdcA involved in peptidoglycan recycling